MSDPKDPAGDPTRHLRRAAKALARAFASGDPQALARVHAVLPGQQALRHADALHVISREEGHDSWPRLKLALEARALDRAALSSRLATALHQGNGPAVETLLAQASDLGRETLALACATYDLAEVRRRLAGDPAAATRIVDGRRPIAALAFSRFHRCGGSGADMLAVAEALLAHGADVNDSIPDDRGAPLSVLYGAVGHGDNMALAEWLLTRGADPEDNESLYHATELGHTDGLRLLLAHGARPEGTNALLRALDFDDAGAAALLLAAMTRPDSGPDTGPDTGQPPLLEGALHHAARRMCTPATLRLLLDHGADPSARAFGHTAHALARIHGNRPAARLIADAGGDTSLTPAEAQLARAADGETRRNDWIDMGQLTPESRLLLCRLASRPGSLPHVRRLIAMGFDPNVADKAGLTPLQLAGWEGLADSFAFLLDQRPDLTHVNRFGGTVFGTILHGSENAPDRAARDHVGCMARLLHHGAALPASALATAQDPTMAAFLSDWATRHPGQVVAPATPEPAQRLSPGKSASATH